MLNNDDLKKLIGLLDSHLGRIANNTTGGVGYRWSNKKWREYRNIRSKLLQMIKDE